MIHSGVKNQSPPWRQSLETHSELMKVKREEQGKFQVEDGRKTCDLVLSAPMSASCVPFPCSLRPSAGDQGRVLKNRLIQNRQGSRHLFPTYLSSLKSSCSHSPTLWLCVDSPKVLHPPCFQCAHTALSPSETLPLCHLLVKASSFSELILMCLLPNSS